MPDEGSVTHWVNLLRAGDGAAAQPLWERYFRDLVRLARKRLAGRARAAADEEDVALKAFDSFCRDAQRGRYPQLADRDGLWRLLIVITAQKALDFARVEQAQKRGGAVDRAEMALELIVGREPSPEFAASVAEECERLLARLPDEELRTLALWKMEGYTNEEIAAKLGCVSRTVVRRLRVIRTLWGQDEVR